ncbi:MAG TPA: hypothetical protein VGI19_10680 [Candidatus Cybelea sp.]
MSRIWGQVGVLGCVAALALAGCGTNGSSTTLPSATQGWVHNGNVVYHVPHYMPSRSAAAQQQIGAASNYLFIYYAGPVLLNPKTYLILWGYKKYGDPDGVAKLLEAYLPLEGGSGHNNIYTQYYETVSARPVFITNPKGQSGGFWDDEKDAVPLNPTDTQVAAEVVIGVKHFGYDPYGSYIVATPHGRSTTGFGTAWCAYHSIAIADGKNVSYTNFPYMPDVGLNCGAGYIPAPKDEPLNDEGVTIVAGHEYGESITDPELGTGWYLSPYEIGDVCAWMHIKNLKFGKKSFTMQPMYSNADQSCVQTYK